MNATAPLVLTQSLLPFLRRSGGRVVNLTSLAARRQLPYFSAYGASKAALEAASASMRIELRKHGVDVVLLEPGLNIFIINHYCVGSHVLPSL